MEQTGGNKGLEEKTIGIMGMCVDCSPSNSVRYSGWILISSFYRDGLPSHKASAASTAKGKSRYQVKGLGKVQIPVRMKSK